MTAVKCALSHLRRRFGRQNRLSVLATEPGGKTRIHHLVAVTGEQNENV